MRLSAVVMIGAALLAAVPAAVAQNYPVKPVRAVMPFPPGGAADALLRPLAPKLGDLLGQQILADPRPGANGNIAAEIVARRPLTVEQVPRALARGCDPVAGCRRRT